MESGDHHQKPMDRHMEMSMTEHAPSHDHHAMMEADFKRRFIASLAITVPVLLLSPTIQKWFSFSLPEFPGKDLNLFALASIIVFYGGWPFYKGAAKSIREGILGMMVLVSLAVGSGYLFSVAATFVFTGAVDFYFIFGHKIHWSCFLEGELLNVIKIFEAFLKITLGLLE